MSTPYQKAQNAEARGEWANAAMLYSALGRDADCIACQLVDDAIKKGDVFRELVQRRLWQAGTTTTTQRDEILRIAHREVYG